jgi:phosphoenolpyruvate---glycerone phosphotransferase subunit DhaL
VSGQVLRRVRTFPTGGERFGVEVALAWFRFAAERIAGQRDFLTQLDAAIGDADHGINMDRGMRAVLECMAREQPATPGSALFAAGSAIVFTVGGAAGPLYGSAFRDAGSALGDTRELDAAGIAAAIRGGLDGLTRIGAAEPGDKTIVDAWLPALDALEDALACGTTIADAAADAAVAAENGARATVPMQARKGRASYLGARSIGHQDPGATSTAILFAAFHDAVASPH